MKIERITVEGGFLDGLDLSFSAGLNVIIGGRGTGKTSIVELLRYCLDARSYTEVSAVRAAEHALAVLQDGQVTISVSTDDGVFNFSRTAGPDFSENTPQQIQPPIILSQADIESVGLQAAGRLELIDSFRSGVSEGALADRKLIASVQSLTTELHQLAVEIEGIDVQVRGKAELEAQLRAISEEEKAVAARSKSARQMQQDLEKVNDALSALVVSSEAISRSATLLQDFSGKVDDLVAFPPVIERWPRQAGETDRLEAVRRTLGRGIEKLGNAAEEFRSAIKQARSLLSVVSNEKGPLDARAREIRKAISRFEEGAGQTSRAAGKLRERLAQLQALEALREEKLGRVHAIQEARGTELDQLDAIWQRRFVARNNVAARLNSQLSPRIRVKPIRAAQLTAYAGAISAALRGSGLRNYADLSTAIASQMSPRELVEIVEQGKADALAEMLEIQPDRAGKLISHLRDHGAASILTARVEDDVRMELLDGTNYKDIENLSMGQRCTVVLPLVLEHKNRVLVVDQPEDNLDNAFIVETVVKAILHRGMKAQLLITTHNANLPVLGNAAKVIVMGSDGRRGFVEREGGLDDDAIVQSITTIMEGGAKAFERRAQFYNSHSALNE